MAKFVFIYTGGAPENMDPGDMDAVIAAWMQWFETLGSAVVDRGTPFASSATVGARAADRGASGLAGYTIVEAADLAGAVALAQGCPMVGNGGSVEVYETHPM